VSDLRFKVGDRVRFDAPSHPLHDQRGTVARIEPSGYRPYAVSHSRGMAYAREDQLKPEPTTSQPIQQAPACPPHSYQHGRCVRCFERP
jgi:hypothetical protein